MQNASAFILPKPSASSLGARSLAQRSASVKVFGRRLTSDGGRHVLGGRRLKTSKGRNREFGRAEGRYYGDLANGVSSGGASGTAN